MKTIRVTGKGNLRLKPDLTRITLTLTGTDHDYGKVLERSTKQTESLKEILLPLGFERSDLKTIQFNVDTEYEGYQEEGIYKQRFLGYRYNHVLKLEFELNNDRLGKILYALANSEVSPEFRITYTLKDQEAAKNELLGKAVRDAKEKAAVLALAADVKLGEIQNIDYSFGSVDFERPVTNRMFKASGAAMEESFDMNIQPDDIEVSDTVTVIWEIR